MTSPQAMKSWSPFGVGVLGTPAGAFAFPTLQPVIKGPGDMGKLKLPGATGTAPWLSVAGPAGFGLASLAVLFRRRKPVADEHHRTDRPVVRVGSH